LNREYEYVPPNNLIAERFVLGACLLDIKVTLESLSLLDPEDFYDMRHQQIFRVMREMVRNDIPVDMITVLEYIGKKYPRENEGNLSSLLASYIDQVSTTATASYQISTIIDCSLKRKIMALAGNMMKIGMDPGKSGEESLSEVEQQIFALTINRKGQDLIHLREALSGAMEEIQENIRDQGIPKATTGFRAVDSVIGGLTPGSVYVLAARPSMGKTALSLAIAQNLAEETKENVLFFSLEMTKEQLAQRLLGSTAKVNVHYLRSGKISVDAWGKIESAEKELANISIYIDDTSEQTLMEMRSKCRRFLATHGDVGLIVVDYLQLIQGAATKRQQNKEQEVAEISRGMKALSKEILAPVLLLSQLSRNVEKRDDKRPQLSDLRDSGSIEQDADVVMLLYREGYYGASSRGKKITEDTVEIIVGKNRNGHTGTIKLRFDLSHAKFYPIITIKQG